MANEKIFGYCICGWIKITLRGLRVHQTKEKSPQDDQRQPCTAQGDGIRRAQSQVEYQGAIKPTIADGHTPIRKHHNTNSLVNLQAAERIPLTEDGRKDKVLGRKKKIIWPKAKDSKVWRKLDSDLALILKNSLKGKVENKHYTFLPISSMYVMPQQVLKFNFHSSSVYYHSYAFVL